MTIMVGLPNLCRLLSESSSVGAGMGYFRGAIFWRDPVLREKENPPKKRERKPQKKNWEKKRKKTQQKVGKKRRKERTHTHAHTKKKGVDKNQDESNKSKTRRIITTRDLFFLGYVW